MSTGNEIRTFRGHSEWVNSVSFSPNSKFALSGSTDKSIRLWNVSTGMLVRTFKGPMGEIKAVAFSPDGKFALSGSMDKSIKLWDVRTGASLKTFSGHADAVNSVSFSPDAGMRFPGARIRPSGCGTSLPARRRKFPGSGSVNAVAFSPDGNSVIAGGRNDNYSPFFKLWDVLTGNEIQTFKGRGMIMGSHPFPLRLTADMRSPGVSIIPLNCGTCRQEKNCGRSGTGKRRFIGFLQP